MARIIFWKKISWLWGQGPLKWPQNGIFQVLLQIGHDIFIIFLHEVASYNRGKAWSYLKQFLFSCGLKLTFPGLTFVEFYQNNPSIYKNCLWNKMFLKESCWGINFLLQPITAQCFLFIPPENIRKPTVF